MLLWFSQPELGLPSKEYYEEESITELYQDTMAKLIESVIDILDEEKEEDGVQREAEQQLVLNNDDSQTWPPWPWPPWGGDEPDGDGGDKPGKGDKTERAAKLAKQVLDFETKIANASLDL